MTAVMAAVTYGALHLVPVPSDLAWSYQPWHSVIAGAISAPDIIEIVLCLVSWPITKGHTCSRRTGPSWAMEADFQNSCLMLAMLMPASLQGGSQI